MGISDLWRGKSRLLNAAATNAPLLDETTMELSTWAPTPTMTALTLEDLYGIQGLATVTRASSIGIPAVAKARHLVCGKIAGFPLVAMTGNAKSARPPSWLQAIEPGRPNFITMTWLVDGMLFHGRAWLLVTSRYADTNKPKSFRLVPEWNATTNTDGALVKAFGQPVAPGDVVRIDGPHEGILNNSKPAIREALAVEAAAAKAADNPVPSVELHQVAGEQLNDEEIAKLVKSWADARRGANGGVAYTNQSVEAKMHGAAPEQLLISGRNAAALNIARAIGLSAWAVDAAVEGSGLTYSSVPARSRELVEYGLQPYMDALTARLSMDDVLANGQWVKFDTAQLLRGSFAERMAGYRAAIDAGIYTAQECRALEDGIPLEGKDS